MAKKTIGTQELRSKIMLLCIYAPGNKIHNMNGYLKEFLSLVKTLGIKYDVVISWKIRQIDTSHFLTKGKLQELLDFVDKNEIDEVVCSKELSSLQERNLSDAINCKVYDRTQLILEIFSNSAHTAEGKTQIDIARLDYLKTRMAGRGKELSQQAGHIGVRGPGETEKEALRRYYATKMKQARKKLLTLEKSRETQRKQRLKSNVPLVALIGYTNAGKSSILNVLTKSNILAEDKLFTTLDTTTKTLFLNPNKNILVSDTVGFISELPHHLVDAFKSTLSELKYAKLILHVVDISNPCWEDHILIANNILKKLKISTKILYVFNKIDLMEKKQSNFELYKPYVLTHTKSKNGAIDLLDFLRNFSFDF